MASSPAPTPWLSTRPGVDIINNQKVTAKNDPTDLLKRIDKQHGTHTIDWAEKIGLGSKKYTIVNIDK